jgi:hypothetical protein
MESVNIFMVDAYLSKKRKNLWWMLETSVDGGLLAFHVWVASGMEERRCRRGLRRVCGGFDLGGFILSSFFV